MQSLVDVGVITIREDEFRAVLRRFPQTEPVRLSRYYNLASIIALNGQTYRVAIVRQLDQGNQAALDLARDMIQDLRPKWLIVTGIAGAVPADEFSLGDVVLSSRIYDFSLEAVLHKGDREFAVSGGPMHRSVEILLANLPAFEGELSEWNLEAKIQMPRPPVPLDDPKLFYGSKAWRSQVSKSLISHFGTGRSHRAPCFIIGAIASSDRLIKDEELLNFWRLCARTIIAIEMESAGVYRAARRIDHEYPMVSIRGISDIVGYRRSHDWLRYACETAASFTFAFITSGLIPLSKNGALEPAKTMEGIQEFLNALPNDRTAAFLRALALLGPSISYTAIADYYQMKFGGSIRCLLSELERRGFLSRFGRRILIRVGRSFWDSETDEVRNASYKAALDYLTRSSLPSDIVTRLSLALRFNDETLIRSVLLEYGDYLIDIGAYDLIREALQVLPELDRNAYLHLIWARSAEHGGDIATAKNHYLAASQNDTKARSLAFYGLANIALGWFLYEDAERYNSALGDTLQEGPEWLRIRGKYLHQKGYFHIRIPSLFSTVEAKKAFKESVEVFKKTFDYERLADTIYHLGEVSSLENNVPEARGYFQEALRLANRCGFPRVLANVRLSIGVLLVRNNELLEALREFRKAEGLYRRLPQVHKMQIAFIARRLVELRLKDGQVSTDSRLVTQIARALNEFPPIYRGRVETLLNLLGFERNAVADINLGNA